MLGGHWRSPIADSLASELHYPARHAALHAKAGLPFTSASSPLAAMSMTLPGLTFLISSKERVRHANYSFAEAANFDMGVTYQCPNFERGSTLG